jgi:hypothetical protein
MLTIYPFNASCVASALLYDHFLIHSITQITEDFPCFLNTLLASSASNPQVRADFSGKII